MSLLQLHGLTTDRLAQQPCQTDHEIVPCGALRALVSPAPAYATGPDIAPDDLARWGVQHHGILAAYTAQATVLPMRIGAVFSGRSALMATVTDNAPQYLKMLEDLEGVREYTVRLSVTGDPHPMRAAAQSGRDFLAVRRDRRDQRTQLQQDRRALASVLLKMLQGHARQVQPAGQPRPERLLDCVALVRSSDVKHLQAMAQSCHDKAQSLGLDLDITGPWPLYSCTTTTPAPGVCDAIGA